MPKLSWPTGNGKEPMARAIGQTFAALQHLTDLALTWGFAAMKKASAAPPAQAPVMRKGIRATATRAVLRVLHFVGSTGDAYYEWYGRMKRRNVTEGKR